MKSTICATAGALLSIDPGPGAGTDDPPAHTPAMIGPSAPLRVGVRALGDRG